MAANPHMLAPELKLEVERTPRELIVHCAGKITLETSAVFQNAMRDLFSQSHTIVVDLTHVTYVESSGLGALVGVWSSSKRKSADLDIRWPEGVASHAPHDVKFVTSNGYVRKLLRLTRLDKLFNIPDE